jgi:Mn2+/Fe2+ NRAMP family transporter
MLRLINNKELMGKYTNSMGFNIVAWTTAVIVIGLTAVMLWQTVSQLRG